MALRVWVVGIIGCLLWAGSMGCTVGPLNDPEQTATTCQDGTDNDKDGKTDCQDPGCQGFTFCQQKTEESTTTCRDGKDNDGDKLIDCADPDCQGYTFCGDGENTSLTCQDKQDNDKDGKIDCDDPDCRDFVFCQGASENTPATCQDGVDNDKNNKIDCDDDKCKQLAVCALSENTSTACQDRKDNDNDSKIDCDDPDCQGFTFCTATGEATPAACQDQKDNDGDNKIDCEDSDCQGFTFCQKPGENTSAACQDKQDNDGDNKIDCEDAECQAFTFCQTQAPVETTPAACQDQKDNDNDGKTDCDDSDCQGFTFCTAAGEATPAACQDKQDNDGDGKIDCADSDCQGFTFCSQQTPDESTAKACQDQQDNDGDGKTDCDDKDCWHWHFCAHYNGAPINDAWGATWDSLPRPAAKWAAADATCRSLGGRLPTATELYRNNMTSGPGGSGISSLQATEYLWTMLSTYRADRRFVVRLSDGRVSTNTVTSTSQYRCIWPAPTGPGMGQGDCYGPPGKGCIATGQRWHLDTWDRPALDYPAAVAECAMANGSIPTLADWTRAIHEGLPDGKDTWLWSAKAMVWYNKGLGHAVIKWQGAGTPQWHSTDGETVGYSSTYSVRSFRCIGLRDAQQQQVPKPTCSGGCLTLTTRRSTLLADQSDRAPATSTAAAVACRALGGDLPSASELTELIHAGLPNGTDQYVWLSDPVYYYSGNYGHAIARWKGKGEPFWSYYGWGTYGSYSKSSSTRPYRCVWHSQKPALPTCSANQVIVRTNGALQCGPGTPGNAKGKALSEIKDDWGAAWDGAERPSKSHADATADCQALGGRLPTATELFRVRASNNPHKSIGSGKNQLWTSVPSLSAGSWATVRVSDGQTDVATSRNTRTYRCIWPPATGDVLRGKGCLGPPGNECFTKGGLVIDSYQRASLDIVGALHECRAVGGELTTFRAMIQLVHQGLPNGTNQAHWLMHPVTWYSLTSGVGTRSYGYATAQWSGPGTPTWDFNTRQGGVSKGDDKRTFRCVYQPFLP